jgi:hypothetical protein
MSRTTRHAAVGAALLAAWITGITAAAKGGGISFAAGVDYRALHTFSIREGRIDSPKPEVDNRLFRQRMDDSIRASLTKKGLREVTTNPDLIVTFHISDADFSGVQRTQPVRVPPIPGQQPGFVLPGSGPRPELFTEGTLVIDVFDAAGSLVWRGTWRNTERNGPALSRKLSADARKLLAKFPPKKR